MKPDKMPYVIYLDLHFLIKKIDRSSNNPENSSTEKIGKHILYGYSMSVIWAFIYIENKHTVYREKYSMKKLCKSLREHAKNIINFEKKKLLPLIKTLLK